jgi:hypothetical protein
MKLDQAKLETLIKVSRLHAAHPHVLSAFEVETLWAVNERALAFDIEAETTDAEWCVVGQALLALLAADRMSRPPLIRRWPDNGRLAGKSGVVILDEVPA